MKKDLYKDYPYILQAKVSNYYRSRLYSLRERRYWEKRYHKEVSDFFTELGFEVEVVRKRTYGNAKRETVFARINNVEVRFSYYEAPHGSDKTFEIFRNNVSVDIRVLHKYNNKTYMRKRKIDNLLGLTASQQVLSTPTRLGFTVVSSHHS